MRATDWLFGAGLFTAIMSTAASIATWDSPPGWIAPVLAAVALVSFALAHLVRPR